MAFEDNAAQSDCTISKMSHESSKEMFSKKLYYRKLWRHQKVLEPSRARLITFSEYARIISSLSEPSSFVLDVGCDSGIFARMLESKGHCNLVGIDLANRFKRRPNISFVVAENTHLPFRTESFNVIFARKFASISDTAESLGEFHKILKDDGKLIIEVPNVKRLKSRIYRALGLTPPYPPKYFPHLYLTPFKKILCEKNFKILRINGDYIFIPLIGNLISLFRFEGLERALGKLKPTLCLHLLAICKKHLGVS